MSGLILAINRLTWKMKTPNMLRLRDRALLSPDINFKVDGVISALKICLAGLIFVAIYNKLSVIEFIGFMAVLFVSVYFWQIRTTEKFFGSTDVERIKSERIKLRRLHKQAELDRERASGQLVMANELRHSYENKYLTAIEKLKNEYIKLDQLRTEAETNLQKAKNERELAEQIKSENQFRNSESQRLSDLLSQTEQELQKTRSELHYLKEQKNNNKLFSAEEMIKIQSEYLKVEQLRRIAEEELNIAKAERKRAMEMFKRAEDELARSSFNTGLLDNNSNNPYEILGVHPSDSIETIREVYKKLICIYHPDKHGSLNILSKKQKNDLMAKINVSYDIVSKQQKVKFN